MSLFGNLGASNNNNQQKPAGSLFGTTQNNTQGSSLFGNLGTNNQQQQQQQQQQKPQGLFGQSFGGQQTQNQGSLFTQQQNNPLAGSLSAGLGGAGNATTDDMAKSRLRELGLSANPREKTVSDQIQTILSKWDPNSSDTVLKHYLYNAVNPAYAPYYQPNAGESEREWETALSNKPKGDADHAYIPVQVRGFKALGSRLEFQANIVKGLQQRLHEMNNSLAAILAKHQQDISVRIDASKRQHAMIAQRTLRLAVKCQVLRNRGYALDQSEEKLRDVIKDLSNKVHNPSFNAREEQIWARLVTLRERARWLEEEGKRVGAAVEAQKQEGGSSLPDNVIQGANRILKDYDGQLVHLAKELEEVRKEFEDWEKDRRG